MDPADDDRRSKAQTARREVMVARLAKALEILRSEVNAKWPTRSRESDGWIGDESHQSRSSDHNPWIVDGSNRVVSAIDLTHDPRSGFDSYAFAEWLRTQRDPRIKYVISNRRIFAYNVAPWQWRRYSGANPHDHHVHISVREDKVHYDDVAPWGVAPITLVVGAPLSQPTPQPPSLQRGSSGVNVKTLQVRLVNRGYKLDIDGLFGYGVERAVEDFQKNHGLYADGIVGPQTWKALA